MKQYQINITVDGPTAAGDITVSGFATARTAVEVAFVVTEALREHYEDALVISNVVRAEPDPPPT